MSKTMFISPVVSEKVYAQSNSLNRFAFIVPGDANKHEVARAVALQYGVEVTNVAIINRGGKSVRTYRNKRFTSGNRSDSKKAYVTLKSGQSLPIFAAVEEAAEPKKTDKKADKKTEKAQKKEIKKTSKKAKEETK